MVLEKQNICKSEEIWTNDVVNQSASKQKAFVLLCTPRCGSRDTPELQISFGVSAVNPYCSTLHSLILCDRQMLRKCSLASQNTRCPFGDSQNLPSLTWAVQLLQVQSAAPWSFLKQEIASAVSTSPYLTHKFFHSLHSMVGL